MKNFNGHILYRKEDFADKYKDDPDYTNPILDRNGDVVLGHCKMCGRGEIELEVQCDNARIEKGIFDELDRQIEHPAYDAPYSWHDNKEAGTICIDGEINVRELAKRIRELVT